MKERKKSLKATPAVNPGEIDDFVFLFNFAGFCALLSTHREKHITHKRERSIKREGRRQESDSSLYAKVLPPNFHPTPSTLQLNLKPLTCQISRLKQGFEECSSPAIHLQGNELIWGVEARKREIGRSFWSKLAWNEIAASFNASRILLPLKFRNASELGELC